ncbi:MAG TPA: zinc ABC transporter substrate-binding protein [Candidatus Avibacteroides excrementipullorum]|jgi:zinc transport system substrate-binding protein|nr:zinc ABC transporter substrate-binding protein [Candidatus Avibacteroides excrementipullorum]
MKTIIRQHILPLAAMLLCIISALSCDSTDKAADTLTVSIAPQKHLVTAIAGDRFRIAVLVPKGMNPENYDPAPKTLLQLSESKAYIRMGSLPFEKTLGEKLSETGSDIPTFDVSEGIETIKTEGPHGHDADPHIWMSMKNAETIAVNTLGILCQIDPDRKDFYQQRCDSLVKAIRDTDCRIKEMLADADKTFIIYHPAMTYFARDYGLQQIAIEKDGKEPAASDLVTHIKTAKLTGAGYLFIQPEFDKRNASIIAEETGLEMKELNPLAEDFTGEMLRFAATLSDYPQKQQ